jgi:tetratricopeptide (TPR) repeat protein/4-amino-4-deoxy-L-arabinose transferase-like glycosyltransferase
MNQSSFILRFKGKNNDFLILGFLIIFLLVSNYIWLKIDNSIVENRDSTIFLSRAIQFIKSAQSPEFNLADGLKRMSLGGRPVLLQLLSIPFLLVFGYSIDAYTYLNFLFYILLVVATYNIGKNVKNRNAGLLAAVLVSCYPSTVRLSKITLTSFAMIACVALAIWFLLNFIKTRSVRDIWLTNLSLAFGFLAHPSFTYGIPISVALLLLYTVFFDTYPKWVTRTKEFPAWLSGKLCQPVFLYGLLPSSLVSIGVILMWYVPFGSPLLNTLDRVSLYVPQGRYLLGPNYFNLSYQFWYAITSWLALSTILAILFWIGIIATNIKRQPYAIILAFIFIVTYFIHNMVPGLSWRYFAQVLPVVAAITSLWVFSIRNRLFSTLLAITCVAISIFNFLTISWGFNSITKPVAILLMGHDPSTVSLCRPSYAMYCSDPPNPEKWPINDIVKTIVSDPVCKKGNCKVAVLPGNIYFFQAIPFVADIEFPEANLDISILLDPGVWGVNVNVPTGYYDIPKLLESDYIVYNLSDSIGLYEDMPSKEWFLATIHFFDSLPPLFSASHQLIAEYQLPDGTKALLYKRVQPLTLEEAEQAVSVLELPEEAKIRKYELFLHLSKKEDDVNKWLEAYQEALSIAQKPEPYLSMLFGLADYYQSSGRTDLAIVTYEQGLSMQPDDLSSQVSLAKDYLARDDCKNAIPHLSEAARIQPIALNYVNLGASYRDCGDLENAIASYKKALRLDSGNVRAHLGLALSYALQHDIIRARAEFNMVIELAPGSPYALLAERWLEDNKNK